MPEQADRELNALPPLTRPLAAILPSDTPSEEDYKTHLEEKHCSLEQFPLP
jgi:hypothetical protein